MVNKRNRNHPKMAELFRLVKYYNLPRLMPVTSPAPPLLCGVGWQLEALGMTASSSGCRVRPMHASTRRSPLPCVWASATPYISSGERRVPSSFSVQHDGQWVLPLVSNHPTSEHLHINMCDPTLGPSHCEGKCMKLLWTQYRASSSGGVAPPVSGEFGMRFVVKLDI